MDTSVNFNVKYAAKGRNVTGYTPLHKYVSNWGFPVNPEKANDEERAWTEAHLADAIARVAEMNGLSNNDVAHVFPYILRMLKCTSEWAK